jgi:phosphoglycolate phosphatase-like HAD superfamily hydrolase
MLEKAGIDSPFRSVIGYDDIGSNQQKPAPDSGIKCLAEIFDDYWDKTILYVGDHETDVRFARNLQASLGKQAGVISIAVSYSGALPSRWQHTPDFIIDDPKDLLEICDSLSGS